MPTNGEIVPQTLDWQGRPHRYAVFVPEDYTPTRAWPAVLYLHGKGERGLDGESHTHHGLGKAIRAHPKRFPCIVVMPQCPPDAYWDGETLDMAMAALHAAERAYRIDPDRVVLTGLSMGGFGTWVLGARESHRWSALLPICGGGDPARAERLAKLPIWCFHGEADPVISVELSRQMAGAVRAAGGNVKYTEFPGVGHNSWDAAYGDPQVIEWMLSQRKN